MELTGKCKEAFEKWFSTGLPHQIGFSEIKILRDSQYRIGMFNRLDPSMQFGVYVDFFKSVDIFIFIEVCLGGGAPVEFPKITWRNSDWIDCYWEVYDDNGMLHPFDAYTDEAKTAAIEKAVEIFNNRKQHKKDGINV